jgi:hypothetical protein
MKKTSTPAKIPIGAPQQEAELSKSSPCLASTEVQGKKTLRRRKISTLPTRVYKFALKPPTLNAELAMQSFCEARIYYNKLVTIENVRRRRYRDARSKLFPHLETLETKVADLEVAIENDRSIVGSSKSQVRTRQVDPEIAARIAALKTSLNEARANLKKARLDAAQHPDLKTITHHSDELARLEVKALRKTMYWGTYQLCEEAIKQASSKSKYDIAYNEIPPHRLASRIGVQFIGSIETQDLENDTQMQILNPPIFRQSPSGIWRSRYQRDNTGQIIRCLLRFRIGSTEKRKPIWAEFPLIYDRPLPPNARIMAAYIKQEPLRERNPWQFHLCIVLESNEFERSLPGTLQEGTTTINFGWRLLENGGLRVATINRDGQTPEFCELPPLFLKGIAWCRHLQSLLDEKFDAVKKKLGAWIATRTDLPIEFQRSFEHLHLWKSQHKLNEIVLYWKSNRIAGDDEIWPVMAEWMDRYLHLHDWMVNQNRRLLNWRDDYYRCMAKKLVTTSARIVIDTFKITDVARRTPVEEEEVGGMASRTNRVIASPGDLRTKIKQAATKYHCEILAAPTVNGTRRCNVCGTVQDIGSLVHDCTLPSCQAQWDQDVNNTDNLQDAFASNEVTPLIIPAKTSENGEFIASQTTSFRAARKALGR